MSADLEQDLRASAEGLTLDRPAHDILARGDRIRRRRRRGIAAGVTSAATLAVLGVAVALPPGSNPVLGPAVASWSGSGTNLTPEQLEVVSETCRTAYTSDAYGAPGATLWELPQGSVPVAAELRDGLALAYFHEGDRAGDCVLELRADGSFTPTGLSSGAWKQLPKGRHLQFQTLGSSDPGRMGGPLSKVYVVVRVSPAVSRVTVEVGGETFEASVSEGLAFSWVADGFSRTEVDNAVFTAYDDADEELEQRDMSSPDW